MRRAALGLLLLAAACQLPGPPQLVRDGAGIFSAEARAEAESRLRAVAAEHGVWAFVVTDPEGDPPRMLDEPMAEADARGVPAVAVLFGVDRLAGLGYSRVSFDSQTLGAPDVDDLLARGDTDEALDRAVDHLVNWAARPPPADGPAPPDPVEAPSANPAP